MIQELRERQEFDEASSDDGNFQPADSTLIVVERPTPLDDPLPSQDLREFIDVPTDNAKRHSLDHDIRMGWIPKTQIAGPIPLSFQNAAVDSMLQTTLEYSPTSVLYLGWRPANTFEVHEKYCEGGSNYPFNQFHLCKSTFLSNFVRKYYPQLNFSKRRPFSGPNPIIDHSQQPLVFDSDYEGGNLDAVLLTRNKEYDLFVRVDSNTRGHCNYFCFKVRNQNPGTYRFHIANLSLKRTLYERGMRPYARSINQHKAGWQQVGTNLKYSSREYKGRWSDDAVDTITTANCLSFDYEFRTAEDEVEFCYCVPYSYSRMLKDLDELEQDSYKKNIVHRSRLCFSLSGVEVPVLTVTNPSNDQTKKYCVLVSGRIHPGESNGSIVMLALLRYLTSPVAEQLREHVIFKVVPMLNPDGVILGNHRTGVSGKDLNRQFTTTNKIIFPEVITLKEYAADLKSRFSHRLLAFFDIHGHSMRKNAFVYGPEYPIFELGYFRSRVLARLMAQKTNMFRYYSCSFNIDSDKERTARSVFFSVLRIDLCYTLESSNHCFFDATTRQQTNFNEKYWAQLGRVLGESINELVQFEVQRENYRDKLGLTGPLSQSVLFPGSRPKVLSKEQPKKLDMDIYRKILQGRFAEEMNPEELALPVKRKKKPLPVLQSSISAAKLPEPLSKSSVVQEPVKEPVKQAEPTVAASQAAVNGWKDDESDKYSQDGADSEPDDHDLPPTELKQFYLRIKENKQHFYEELSRMGEDERPKKKKGKKLSLLLEPIGSKFVSVNSERLEEKTSTVLPVRPVNNPQAISTKLHLPTQCKKKSCHCKKPRTLDYNELKNMRYEFEVPPAASTSIHKHSEQQSLAVSTNAILKQDIQKRTAHSKKEMESEKLIRINPQTLQRLIRNSNLNLVHRSTARDNYAMFKGVVEPARPLVSHSLRKKKSIKALHNHAKDRQVYRTLETVLSNVRSLPKIVVTRNL